MILSNHIPLFEIHFQFIFKNIYSARCTCFDCESFHGDKSQENMQAVSYCLAEMGVKLVLILKQQIKLYLLCPDTRGKSRRRREPENSRLHVTWCFQIYVLLSNGAKSEICFNRSSNN